MVTALVSLLTHRPIKPHVGMTGEITLRGQVLPVGGVKEKLLAAHRAGLKTIILPMRNEVDLEELPKEVKAKLSFKFVRTIDEVLRYSLEPKSVSPDRRKQSAVSLNGKPKRKAKPKKAKKKSAKPTRANHA
jgi:ATP-dependent Lon protease